MRNMINCLSFVFICALLLPTVSSAGKVEVYTVRNEGMSHMELRERALAEGFARAVADEAQVLLGGAMDANRRESVRRYYVAHSTNCIQGYTILSSQKTEDGLMMALDVRIHRKTLRDDLTSQGFFETVRAPLEAAVTWPEDIAPKDLATIRNLMTFSGIKQAAVPSPAFSLSYGPKGTFKGTLFQAGGDWVYAGKDLSEVWTNLWSRFFTQAKGESLDDGQQRLTIAGWFTPDGVLEFDRVLKEWDYAVQGSRLVEMDVQPTGVGATWEMRILDSKRLASLLNAFLPPRGLSFQLDREPGQ